MRQTTPESIQGRCLPQCLCVNNSVTDKTEAKTATLKLLLLCLILQVAVEIVRNIREKTEFLLVPLWCQSEGSVSLFIPQSSIVRGHQKSGLFSAYNNGQKGTVLYIKVVHTYGVLQNSSSNGFFH